MLSAPSDEEPSLPRRAAMAPRRVLASASMAFSTARHAASASGCCAGLDPLLDGLTNSSLGSYYQTTS